MKTTTRIFGPFAIAIIMTSCMGNKKPSIDSSDWKSNMHQLADSLSQVLPLAANSKRFNDPAHAEKIETQLEHMAKVARDLNKEKFDPGKDPVIKFSSKQFASQMQDSLTQFRLGNKRFARQMINGATSYCMTCHTRADSGQPELIVNWNADVSYLTPMQTVEYYIAVRRYDLAFPLLEKTLKDPNYVPSDIRELEVTVEKILAVAVRVKQDPELTEKIVVSFAHSANTPQFLKQRSSFWRSAIVDWKKTQNKFTKMTREQKLETARRLIRDAETRHFVERKADLIQRLRASGILHQLMQENKLDTVYKQSLYFAGLVAESLREANLWTLDESYYEACIRQSPHTDLARKCYVRMESTLLSEIYVDDDSSYIPSHLKAKLQELESLASEKDTTQLKDIWMIKEHAN